MVSIIDPNYENTVGIKVEITRYVDREPQPGIIECAFVDAHGITCRFLEKTAIVSSEYIDENSRFPLPGVLPGEVIERFVEASGRPVVRVEIFTPFTIYIDGNSQFDVLAERIVVWNAG